MSKTTAASVNFVLTGTEIEMIWVSPGAFCMGAEDGSSDEKPTTLVTLSRGYWLSKFAITQAQWRTVMGESALGSDDGKLPQREVRWTEAIDFSKRISERERKANRLPESYEYTLPTEAEWEYAARAGTTTPFPKPVDEIAWYEANSGDQPHPVGMKQPNAWGLYDMCGNVAEWCWDWYSDYPGAAVVDWYGNAPRGIQLMRSYRGGCWYSSANGCRSARRDYGTPIGPRSFVGFRLALSSIPRVQIIHEAQRMMFPGAVVC